MLHMEQKGYKDYKLEIVNELLSNANHIRGIAKNPRPTIRKINNELLTQVIIQAIA